MKILKYAAIVVMLATGMSGCEKKAESNELCDKDIDGAIAVMNELITDMANNFLF
jgi:glutamine synthetase